MQPRAGSESLCSAGNAVCRTRLCTPEPYGKSSASNGRMCDIASFRTRPKTTDGRELLGGQMKGIVLVGRSRASRTTGFGDSSIHNLANQRCCEIRRSKDSIKRGNLACGPAVAGGRCPGRRIGANRSGLSKKMSSKSLKMISRRRRR